MLLLARGMYLNRVCSDVTLRAVTLSVTPSEYLATPPTNYSAATIERLLTWYTQTFTIDKGLEEGKDLVS